MGVIYLPDPNAEFQKQMLQQSREHYERSRPGGTDDQDKMKALLGQQALSDAQYSAEQRRINDPIAAANTAAEQARAASAEARLKEQALQNTETHNAALKASQAAVAAEEKRVAREAALRTAGSYKFNDAPPTGFQLPPTSLFSSPMPDMNLGAEAGQAPGALPATGFRLPQWTSPSRLPQMPDMDLGAEAGRATGTLPPVSELNLYDFADLGDGARNALQSRVAQDFPKAGPIKGTEMQRAWDDEKGAQGLGGNSVLAVGEGPGGLTSSGDTPEGQAEKERIAQATVAETIRQEDAKLRAAAGTTKRTDGQMKAFAALRSMEDGSVDLRTLEKTYDPSGAVPLFKILKSEDRQKYDAAAGIWIQGVLRTESGGAVTPAEIASYKEYFIPTVEDAPGMVAFKAKKRAAKEAAIAEGYQLSGGDLTGRVGPMPTNFPQPKGEGAAAAAGGTTFTPDGRIAEGEADSPDGSPPPPPSPRTSPPPTTVEEDPAQHKLPWLRGLFNPDVDDPDMPKDINQLLKEERDQGGKSTDPSFEHTKFIPDVIQSYVDKVWRTPAEARARRESQPGITHKEFPEVHSLGSSRRDGVTARELPIPPNRQFSVENSQGTPGQQADFLTWLRLHPDVSPEQAAAVMELILQKSH